MQELVVKVLEVWNYFYWIDIGKVLLDHITLLIDQELVEVPFDLSNVILLLDPFEERMLISTDDLDFLEHRERDIVLVFRPL